MAEMRTIRVTGKGNLKVRPDTTRITLTLEGTDKEYGKALELSSKDTDKIKDILSKFGFDRSDLKTLNFDVNPQYESYKKQGTYRERLVGYTYTHILKVEFESDNERLGKILYALAKSDLTPRFRISYTVKDPEAAKNELLAKAIEDAAAKASVLTKAAGVKLKDIQNIDYSWGQINFEVNPIGRYSDDICCLSMGIAKESLDYDIEPDDIEVNDTVTVVWEIG